MIEIIKRKECEKSEKQQIDGDRVQISFNSWGHLVIRVIQGNDADTLIVLDQKTSDATMNFIKKHVHFDELPF